MAKFSQLVQMTGPPAKMTGLPTTGPPTGGSCRRSEDLRKLSVASFGHLHSFIMIGPLQQETMDLRYLAVVDGMGEGDMVEGAPSDADDVKRVRRENLCTSLLMLIFDLCVLGYRSWGDGEW